MPRLATAVAAWSGWITIGKRDKLSAAFLPIVFRPAYPRVIEVLAWKRSFRCLPSSSALDLLEGLPVFQIWHECRQRFGHANLEKKIDVRIFCFRLRRLKMVVLKNHFVSEVGPFLRDCHIYISHEISIEHPSVGLASLAQLHTSPAHCTLFNDA